MVVTSGYIVMSRSDKVAFLVEFGIWIDIKLITHN